MEQQASLHHLHANVSTDGSEVTIGLETKVPPTMKNSCLLKLSLSLPTSPPIEVASTSLNCSTTLHTFSHLAPHTYYNVCAALHVEAKSSSPRAQCLLAAAPRLRTAPRSVRDLSLLLSSIYYPDESFYLPSNIPLRQQKLSGDASSSHSRLPCAWHRLPHGETLCHEGT